MILTVVGYKWRKSCQIEKANNVFDPIDRKLIGLYLPWPLGSPSLFGQLDNQSAKRLRDDFSCEYGTIKKDNMKLIIHASDGSFFVHYK